MVQFFFPLIAALSFGPALLMLYFSLSRYTWPKVEKAYFDDRWIFGLLAVGIIVGAVFVYFQDGAQASGGGVLFVILFSVIQQLVVLVVLNFPRVRLKGGGRFYGYSLGTSIAAGIALGEYGIVFRGGSAFDYPTLAILLVYTFGLELMGGATGSVIGHSIETGDAARGMTLSSAMLVVFNFLMIPVFSFRPSALTFAFDSAALLLSAVVYAWVYRAVLPAPFPSAKPERRKRIM